MKKRIGYVSNSSVSSFCMMGVDICSTNNEGHIIDYDTRKVIFDISKCKDKMISCIKSKEKQRNIRKQPDYPEGDLLVETEGKWKEIFDEPPENIQIFDGGFVRVLGMYMQELGEDETRRQFRHRVFLELQKIGYIGDENLIDIIEGTDE